MADTPDEADKVETTPNEQNTSVEGDNPDNDPMIREMREAEKEIEAAAAGKSGEEGSEGDGEGQSDTQASEGQQSETDPNKVPATDPRKETVMVPKARLDEVINQRDRYKEQATYYQGVADTQKQLIESSKSTGQSDGKGQTAEADKAPDYDTQINDLKAKKLELADQFEEGTLSAKEWKAKELEIENQIDDLREKKTEEKIQATRTEAKNEIKSTVNANNAQQILEDEGEALTQKHPYCAEIDKLPPAIAKGVWQEIADQAVKNLAQKGINPGDKKLDSQIAFLREKARLTDEFGPRYTGKQLSQPQKQLSETQQQRSVKLEVAQAQPPALEGTSTTERKELSEADIEKMSQEEVADLLASNPGAALKAAKMQR